MKGLDGMIRGEPVVSRMLAAGDEIFLVGGYIRDMLRGVSSGDVDILVRGDIRGFICDIFPGITPTVIEFKRGLLVRVIMGGYTLDFSVLKGELEDDLLRRDFTMNAIAWSAKDGLADPLNGANDIGKKLIRAVSEKNFRDDPVRLLRAYRFSGEFGWEIEKETRTMIKKLRDAIRVSARERITSEVVRLLNSKDCLRALRAAEADGVLSEIASLSRKQLRDNLSAIARVDLFVRKMHERSGIAFEGPFSQGLSYRGLIRMEQLLFGSDMKKNLLRLSAATLNRVAVAGRLLRKYRQGERTDAAGVYDLFMEADVAAIDFAVLTREQRLFSAAKRFLNMGVVLSAERIMEITGLGSGPELGTLLKKLRRMQFLGEIRSENGAVKWLRRQF